MSTLECHSERSEESHYQWVDSSVIRYGLPIQKLPSKTVIPGLTRNPGAFAWIPAFAGKTNGDSFLPGVFRRAESGTQNDSASRQV
ncbi:MAG: hypothetical protein WC749_04180 [Dehalococcoidia bacterium]